jgi:hypothetical protein
MLVRPDTKEPPMTRDQLTAILNATRTDALYLDDDSYIDWTGREADTVIFEAGDSDGNAVQLTLTRTDLETLVHRLAATLLTD